MARPIPAVGLASALVQTIDSCINILRKDHPIAQPTSSNTPPVENAVFLQALIHNLYRLIDLIDQSELKRLQDEKAASKSKNSTAKLSEAAQMLLKLCEGVKEHANALIDALIAAQARLSFGDPRFGTARDALMNGVWKKSEVTGAKKKLRALRKDVDTALLLAMRQYLDQSAESGLPVFTAEDGGRLQHWEKWQNGALDDIHANEWKFNKKKNVEEFSKIVDELILAEKEALFCERMFDLLLFEELDERVNSIKKPDEGTCQFIFGETARQVGGLLEWFGNTSGEGLYWITGKPGSGKSTLMKYLFRNPRIFASLETWSGASPGITSGFFFWSSGTSLQNSPLGLLRSILYESLQDMIFGPLEQDRGVIQWLFSDRWNAFTSYGGGLSDFTFPELRAAFELMISDLSKKFLFLIDGLDETDDYPKEIVDLILSAAKKDHVKFCVSSRSTPMFQTAFENRPRMVIDEWTNDDVHPYLANTFNRSPKLEGLRGKMDGQEEISIVNNLATKAAGNWAWAKLASTYLLNSLQEGDDFLMLKDRSDHLPYHIPDLISHILAEVPVPDVEQIYRTHTLLEAHTSPGAPSLLALSFALTAEASATLAADVRPLKPTEAQKRVDDMLNQFSGPCNNIFAMFDFAPPESQGTHISTLKCAHSHRTIRDALNTPSAFARRATPAPHLDTTRQWANAHLWTLKTLSRTPSGPSPLSAASAPLPLWKPLSSALESSLAIFASTKKFPLAYTDAALTTAIFLHFNSDTGSDLPAFTPSSGSTGTNSGSGSGLGSSSASTISGDKPSALLAASTPTALSSTLDLALLLNLQAYLALKLKTSEKKDVRHALDFTREVNKRLGKGGESIWLAGEGKERLRAEYAKVRTEVEALAEYYAKMVRFGSVKPFVEVPDVEG